MGEIYYNGDILDDSAIYDAMAVERGKVIGLGSRQDLINLYKGFNLVDLETRTLLLVSEDSKLSDLDYSAKLFSLDLGRLSSLDELLSLIRLYIAENKVGEGEWVVCRNFHESKDFPMPKRWDLDPASNKNPLVLVSKSGRRGTFNTRALETLTTEAMMEVEGLLEVKKGFPTGYMEENPFWVSIDQIPGPAIGDLRDFLQEAYGDIYGERSQSNNPSRNLKGQKADFIILSQNPLKLGGEDLKDLKLWAFYRGGRPVFRDIDIIKGYR